MFLYGDFGIPQIIYLDLNDMRRVLTSGRSRGTLRAYLRDDRLFLQYIERFVYD